MTKSIAQVTLPVRVEFNDHFLWWDVVDATSTETDYRPMASCLIEAHADLVAGAVNGQAALRKALIKARNALVVTQTRQGTSYDWNTDPDDITLAQAEAFTTIDSALAAALAGREGTTE